MAAESNPAEIGWAAADFALRGTEGRIHNLHELAGPHGLVVAFICNHCPYVKAILPRLVRDARELEDLGVHLVGINSNDATTYPEDSFEHMRELAPTLSFPYLHDPDQSAARAYGAVCTPDFFGFDAGLRLRYRGRLDASRKHSAGADAPRELFEAMRLVAQTGHGPQVQHASIGCSIKWREDTH